MTQMNKVIEIVKYHEGLAAGIAKMWNLSRESWGGDTRVKTEEQVKTTEANSDNIELYLAVDGDEVVGYCGLSEYKEDTGSLYIPLLNVRPDYHGHKIGKKLVLKALEKTMKLGWPRLDLYTWPGNTKAVPLYKKCGFFWEDRDDTTHLMNFIPQILNTPLLKPMFEKMDWYDSSVRQIEIKPDGVKENGFTFYEYSWQNENTSARVQFERTSRGISLIETDDFLLEIKLDNHEVIQQEEREIQIRIVNKGIAPLSFKASGTGADRIHYDFDTEIIVDTEKTISAKFTVQKGEEPSAWRTHPSISANVAINNLECVLKLGVLPINPAKIKASYSGNLSFLNKLTSIDVEVTNNLTEDAEFLLSFPEDELVLLQNDSIKLNILAGRRKTVPVALTLMKHGFYKPNLTITATKGDGQSFTFEQEITVAFKGFGEKFGGESKDFWHIFNGLGQVNVRKRDLLITAAKNTRQKQPFAFLTPKLGKPYSLEFTKKKPTSLTWEENNSSIELKIILESTEMVGLQLTQNYQLFGDGILQTWADIENIGSSVHPDVAFSQSVYHEFEQVYFPLDGKVVYFSENRPLEFGDLDSKSISGNWYFSEGTTDSIGLSWAETSKAAPEGWRFMIEDHFGEMEPGTRVASGTITLSIGAFQSVDEFRAYAEQTPILKKSESTCELDFSADQFVIQPGTEPSFKLTTHRNSYLDGALTVGAEHHTIEENQEKSSYSMTLQSAELEPLSIIEADFAGNGTETRFRELLLSPSGKVSSAIEDLTFTVDNGCIRLKSAPNFYPGIYDISVNGQEWLDHSYPDLTAKSWWNPWAGGMKTVPYGINTFSLLKESSSASIVELSDQEGNKWTGLAITTGFTEHKEWKGVRYVQYYLMLPNVPVVASFAEVTDDGGKILSEGAWETDLFLGADALTDLSISVNDRQLMHTYLAGSQELPLILDGDSYIATSNKPEKLYIIPNLEAEPTLAYTNKQVLQIASSYQGLASEKGMKTAPLFILFDERKLSGELVKKLRRVQFQKEKS